MTQSTTQTRFQKDLFRWDGMYLHYTGRHNNSITWEQFSSKCHPSARNDLKPEFIARFKYRKPYKTWINFLVKNFTVEEYLGMIDLQNPNRVAPLHALESKGFISPNRKRRG